MFKRIEISTLLTGLAALLVVGCAPKGQNSNVSQATGWAINSSRGGFEYKTNYKGQETAPGTIFIQGSTFIKGRVQDDVMREWNNAPARVQISSFYMDEHEVTNLMYLEYLDWLEKVFKNSGEGYDEIYTAAIPDTLVWRNQLGFNEDMVNNYLRHPAFRNHPVVGVSWQQAINFAKWRTNRVNESILEREGWLSRDLKVSDTISPKVNFNTETYLRAPEKVYGGALSQDSPEEPKYIGRNAIVRSRETDSSSIKYARLKDGVLLPEYRLPTEIEWEYAALGLAGIREYNSYRGKKKFPWSGDSTRSQNRKNEGDQLANFKQGKGDYSGISGWSDDNAIITAPVREYPPNDFGLYGMAGNVAEWVADVYRPITYTNHNDFNYYRGNFYTKPAIGEDGKAVVIDDLTNVQLSPNNKVFFSQLPGEIVRDTLTENDYVLRSNFNRSDNRNYLDGDASSARSETDTLMYKNPVDQRRDFSRTKSTLISDQTRVIKGGSWKDRAYWMDPAQRRYMPEYMAADYVGFRCAMSYLGSSKTKKKPRG